jgi:hypothetical protein
VKAQRARQTTATNAILEEPEAGSAATASDGSLVSKAISAAQAIGDFEPSMRTPAQQLPER